MARLNKKQLIARAIDAIVADGWAVARVSADGDYPARFSMERDGVLHMVRLYIWNLSHGGKSRSEEEFRIQVTGIERFEPEANGRTLILGWSEEFGVFAGFDVQHRLGALGSSPSIQINATTLTAAGADGAARQDKSKGEWALGVRPDKLGRYVQHLTAAHSGELGPILDPDDRPTADPLASEIALLANGADRFDLDGAEEANLRAQVIAGVDDVLAALDARREETTPQIGHNQPPGPIEDQPVLALDIEAAAQEIREQLGSGEPDPRAVGRAGAFLAWAGKLLEFAKREGAKVLDKGKDMVREYLAKALWGAVGTIGVMFKEGIVETLRHLATGILNWLQHISIF